MGVKKSDYAGAMRDGIRLDEPIEGTGFDYFYSLVRLNGGKKRLKCLRCGKPTVSFIWSRSCAFCARKKEVVS